MPVFFWDDASFQARDRLGVVIRRDPLTAARNHVQPVSPHIQCEPTATHSRPAIDRRQGTTRPVDSRIYWGISRPRLFLSALVQPSKQSKRCFSKCLHLLRWFVALVHDENNSRGGSACVPKEFPKTEKEFPRTT